MNANSQELHVSIACEYCWLSHNIFKFNPIITENHGITDPNPQSQLLDPQSKLKWRRGADLPVAMAKPHLVRIGHYIYCGGGVTADTVDIDYLVFKYDATTDTWTRLPPSPTYGHGLSTFNGQLVSTGGVPHDAPGTTPTNSVYVFQDSNWVAALPPMHTARFHPSTFTYNTHLIVCGGVTSWTSVKQYTCTSTVEMLNSETGQWSTLAPLPSALRMMSVAVCNDTCYLIGGEHQGGKTQRAYSAPLPLLTESASHPSPWEVLPNWPLFASAAAVLGGCVLALGGTTQAIISSTDVHLYSRSSKSWRTTAVNLPIALYWATSTTLVEDSIIVVGGRENPQNMLSTVFILKFEN